MERRDYEKHYLPKEYRPMSAWGYVWINILFAIPVVGLICLIAFCFSSAKIARRNYARSFFAAILLAIIVTVVAFVAMYFLFGGIEGIQAFIETVKQEMEAIMAEAQGI